MKTLPMFSSPLSSVQNSNRDKILLKVMDFISKMDVRDQPHHQNEKERLGRMSTASQELAKWKKQTFLSQPMSLLLCHVCSTQS